MKNRFLTWFTGRRLTIILPLAVLSCTAPAAFDGASGEVEVREPSRALNQRGDAEFAEYKKNHPVSTDLAARERVMRVATRLTPVISGPRWEFEVFADSSANAFALPGGKVGINTGLLSVAKTDGQLAAALAHEMAHVTSNHAQSRIQNQQGIQLGSVLLGSVLGGEQGGDRYSQMAEQGGQLLFGLPFSRAQELAADQVGTIFMARAGYDPNEAVALWENMAARGGGGGAEFLSTHPLSSTRIAQLKAFMPYAERQRR